MSFHRSVFEFQTIPYTPVMPFRIDPSQSLICKTRLYFLSSYLLINNEL